MAYLATRCDTRTLLQRQLDKLALLHVPTIPVGTLTCSASVPAEALQVHPTTDDLETAA